MCWKPALVLGLALVVEGGGLLGDDDAFDAVSEVVDVEVDEEAGFYAGEAEDVFHVLDGGFVEGGGGGGDDDAVFDEEVDTDGAVDAVAFVGDGEGVVAVEEDFSHAEFEGEAVAVGFGHEAGAEVVVDFHAGSDDEVGEFLGVEFHGALDW